ncbi:MAG TPA: hypothetical protein VNU19_01220 [Candidatus Acidoferrum sp.]|jgi:hypothetical protein|nr:hypothetical protein [Candidatus Acidoferrum sp.]
MCSPSASFGVRLRTRPRPIQNAEAHRPAPLSIKDDMLGGEKSAHYRYAQSGFDEPAPRQLFNGRDYTDDRNQLNRKWVGRRS